MRDRTIAVLSIVALIVTILAGFTWFYNHSMMRNVNMNMAQSPNTPVAPNSMQMPDSIPMGGSANIKNDTIKSPSYTAFNKHDYAKNLINPKQGQPVKRFVLTAQEARLEIKNGLTIPVWTYNGTVPGPEIRVTQGDFVQVELRNILKDPVTIHWHGYPLLSAMDGVPGLNQDSVKPGETFIYEFSADVPGTYWYHSHQEGAKQVDKGLYGALIVEPKNKGKIDKDYTLILDEWMENPADDMDSMPGMGNEKGNHSVNSMPGHGSSISDMQDEEMMSSMYNIYTVNGKSGSLISPLEVKKGEVVRLRFINAGYRSHGVHIPGQDFKVVSTDGQDINGAGLIKDQVLVVAPGERYDVEFTVTSEESFIIDAHDNNKFNDQLKIPVIIVGGNGKTRIEQNTNKLPIFDLTSYGKPGKGQFTLEQKYEINYPVELSTKPGESSLKYIINGKTFDELPPLRLDTGDIVKITFDNKSRVDHPMHLHGHFFQILSRNDDPVSGAPIIKDTLLVKPGEKYVVAFKADNPGAWVQHCHELHHAAAGMMQRIIYPDFKSNYTPDPNNKFNKPE